MFQHTLQHHIQQGLAPEDIYNAVDGYTDTLKTLRDLHFCQELVAARWRHTGPLIVQVGASHLKGIQDCLYKWATQMPGAPHHSPGAIYWPLTIMDINKKGLVDTEFLPL